MLRTPTSDELAALLALNNAHASEVGELSAEDFAKLIAMSFYVRMTEAAEAFLVGLEHGTAYESPNYRWFAARFPRFAYIDRVVVAPHARQGGSGRLLYGDFMQAARKGGHTRIACEVNIDPPNPASDAFHAALGFIEMGRAYVPQSGKTVRYLAREI